MNPAVVVYISSWIAANAALAGTWVMLQTSTADIERWVGGGVLFAASIYMVRWALKVSARNEESTMRVIAAAEHRAEIAEGRVREVQERYEVERRLRLDLEALGCKDHREGERRLDPREER